MTTITENKWKFINRKSINVDITHRCPLECPRCQRQIAFTHKRLKVHGSDLSLKQFSKIINHFYHINFCGQVSDPVHHPKFISMLKMIYENSNSCNVHHATGYKKMEWYIKAFQSNPKAKWWFGIDGTPDVSHKYRINQDGQKLFEIMRESVKHLQKKPLWQYIIFRYNEDPKMIKKARQMADDIGVQFMILHSSRWLPGEDPYRPLNSEVSLDLRNT
tara:strand:+ start:714 stop:1367 length:654 start_codon:yes stop_codon:yes gene_type:complete